MVGFSAFGQGWSKVYPRPGGASGEAISVAPDGSLLVGGYFGQVLKDSNLCSLLDTHGDSIAAFSFPGQQTTQQLLSYSNGDWLIHSHFQTPQNKSLLRRVDVLGNTISQSDTLTFFNHENLSFTEIDSGGIALLDPSTFTSIVYRFDSLLNQKDTAQILLSGYVPGFQHAIQYLSNGDFAISFRNVLVASRLARFDTNFDTIWTRTLAGATGVPSMVTELPGGDLVMGTVTTDTNSLLVNVLRAYSAAGSQLWTLDVPVGNGNCTPTFLDADASGEILIGGTVQNDGFMAMVSPSGQLRWKRLLEINGDNHLRDGLLSPQGNAVACGYSQPPGASGNYPSYLWVVSLDSLGNTTTNYVSGRVWDDQNGNCIQDPGELALSQWCVDINGLSNTQRFTDVQGEFEANLSAGNYLLSTDLNAGLWQASPCQVQPVAIGLNQPYDSLRVDLPLRANSSCPYLEVDIGTGFLRPCSSSVYTINWRNSGTADAFNAYILVSLDSLLSPLSSSLPWTSQVGNTLRFDLNTVPIGSSGSIQLNALVSCQAVLSQALCAEAHIYPDSFCFAPDPGWDGSSVAVEATCIQQDSIQFKIKNQGQANMLVSGGYVIIEDNIMRVSGNFQLNAGDSLVWKDEAEGSTWTIEADQTPAHQGNDRPIISMEGCGTDSSGNFSTGYLTRIPHNDADPFVSIFCLEVTAAFDPNDKLNFPKGLETEHFITNEDELEYLIRFQNTGNDTAFFVQIRDTLSEFLDISSLQPGASSHPYTLQTYGNSQLEFSFANILLPDSNTNEPFSHGFVKFRIQQQPALAPGTRIDNRAGIYFDYNAPVITNTAFNTLRDSFWIILGTGPLLTQPIPVRIYPNPFTEACQLDLRRALPGPVFLEVFDLNGKLLRQQQFHGQQILQMDRGNLPPGLYLLRVRDVSQTLMTGKVIAR